MYIPEDAVTAALTAGESVWGMTSPNPPVGAAILDTDGQLVGVGATQPVGGPHAEIMALRQAGAKARGGTAIVTLEPCNHTGRTGPCSRALVEAGVKRIVYFTEDPFPEAAGGAAYLASQRVQVCYNPRPVKALEGWLAAIDLGRPRVTLKFAQTLDGFTAAVDGSSQWITGPQARHDVHVDRIRRDAIIIGTGTALSDNPSLTARDDQGTAYEESKQPRRVVIGSRDISQAAPHLVTLGYTQYPNISTALQALWFDGARDVLVEGGAQLAASFMQEGLVDCVRAYVSPQILGSGKSVLSGWQAETLAQAWRYESVEVKQLGADIRWDLRKLSDDSKK